MSFRRFTAGIFIFLFVIVSLPTFLYFGLSDTVLRGSFYEGPIVEKTHDLLLNATAKNLLTIDDVIVDYFSESDLKAEMLVVFPLDLFKSSMTDLGAQVEKLKYGSSRTITISMDVFRRSLLTLANNLSYKLFQSLPLCKGGEVPAEDLRGLPTCIPEGVEYNLVAAPFAKQFENSVYLSVPEIKVDLDQVRGDNGVSLTMIVGWFGAAKNILYASLLFILVMIALLVYSPFSLVAKYEGIAFLFSGVCGYLFCLGLSLLPGYLLAGANFGEMGSQITQYVVYAVSAVSGESQKIALVFLALGAVLVLVRVFMVSRFNEEK